MNEIHYDDEIIQGLFTKGLTPKLPITECQLI